MMGTTKVFRYKRFISFLSKLKERHVLRVAVAYVVVTWIVLQVGEATFEALILPTWSETLLVVFIMLGFPFALLLAWAYELTPDGIVKDTNGEPGLRAASESPRQDDKIANNEHVSPSIAVLNFEDMSSEQNQTYFCEGIAEEILSALNEVDGLNVAARLASFQFSSKSADIREIGRKLNVSVVLEGSVRKVGERIRITIQLINARTGYQFWAGQYNHDLKDIFDIQEQMARAVVSAMRLSLDDNRLIRPITKSTEAYDLFLQAKKYFNRPEKQEILFARHLFERAVEIDPGFGLAWAKLASTHVYEYLCGDPNGNARSEAKRISEIALRLAPGIAASHIARGSAHAICLDFAQADVEFAAAVHLNPASFSAWFTWARSKTYQGDNRKAIDFYQKASDIRLQDYQSVLMQVGLLSALGDAGRAKEKAKEGLLRARAFLELSPDEKRAWNMGAFALLKLGKVAEAKVWMETSMQNSSRHSILSYNAASFYAVTGDIDKSLEYLAQAVESGCLNLGWLEKDAGLDLIRDDPRYQEIITRFKGSCSLTCKNVNPACL